MSDRTALLIPCSQEEADTIRGEAKRQHRGVSGYILHILIRAVEFEEILVAKGHRVQALNRTLSRTPIRTIGPRTTILLRCSTEESQRIRRAARMRDTTISGFVLQSLRRSWKADEMLHLPAVDRK
jgi:hypothetical protein